MNATGRPRRTLLASLSTAGLGLALLAAAQTGAVLAAEATPATPGNAVVESTASIISADYVYTANSIGEATITGYTGATAELAVPATIDGKKVVAIAAGAFENNAALTSVSIPGSVATIGERAFANCPNLSAVTLSEGLVSMGGGAFLNDDKIVAVTIPTTYRESGTIEVNGEPQGPFGQCDSLTEVTFANGLNTIGANLLTGCTTPKITLYIPNSVTSISIDALSTKQWTTIVANPGTEAQRFANRYNQEYVDPNIYATFVGLDRRELSLQKGSVYALQLTLEPADCTEEIVWSSNNPAVVSVSNTGTVTAVSTGRALVTVTVGKLSASCTVDVYQPVTSIDLNRTGSFLMPAGEIRQLVSTALPDDATNKNVTWSSSNPNVAKVNAQTGVVTGVAEGTATITATANDGFGAARSVDVTVINNLYRVSDPTLLATSHPYPNNCTDAWTYTLPGASRIAVTFDSRTQAEYTFDYIEVYEQWGNMIGSYTGTELAGTTLYLNGDTVTVRLVSDEVTSSWGFAVTKVSDVSPAGWVVVDGTTYYYVDGAPVKGEIKLDDGWHYFDINTGAMVTGLVTLPDGRTVYYNANGVMMTGEVVTPEGTLYFDPATGALVPTDKPAADTAVIPTDLGAILGDSVDATVGYLLGLGLKNVTVVDQATGKTVTDYDGYVMYGIDPMGTVELNTPITVYVTAENSEPVEPEQPTTVAVPDIPVGTPTDHAVQLLEEAGLAYEVTDVYSDEVNAFAVISVDPAPGTLVEPGSTVRVVSSLGAEPTEPEAGLVAVPDIPVGTPTDHAVQLLEEAGLAYEVTDVYSDEVNAFAVISVDPAPGTLVEPGSTVRVTSSLGAEELSTVAEPEASANALDITNQQDYASVNTLLTQFSMAYHENTMDVSTNEALMTGDQVENLVFFGINYLLLEKPELIESIDPAEYNGVVDARVDALEVIDVVEEFTGVQIDPMWLTADYLTYDGLCIYFVNAGVPATTSGIMLAGAITPNASLGESFYQVDFNEYGGELAGVDVDRENAAYLAMTPAELEATLGLSGPTRRVGTATIQVALAADGVTRELHLIEYALVDPTA